MNRRHLVASAVVSSVALTTRETPRLVAAQEATPQASPDTCPTTTPEANTALARRWYDEVLTGHDLAVLDELLLADGPHSSPTFPDLDSSRAIVAALVTGFPDVVATVEQTVAEGDFVTVRWTFTGTHDGEYLGYAPTGLTATVTGINIFQFACGRIAAVWSQPDLLGQLRQLGFVEVVAPGMATPTS